MWTHLDSRSAQLEQVFEPLNERAARFKVAWSIAELVLSKEDIEWLRSWFQNFASENSDDWIMPFVLMGYDCDLGISYRQMLGSLLICVGAETCRQESREDSVWPAIRNILPKSHALRSKLFLLNGQPSPLTKEVIVDAVHALNLRNAMDIEGTQQWFTTIKLQFGFTFRGAKNRLAEWLVNLGRPHAVQYLDGESEFSDLTSESFRSLWRVLKQFRRGLISETEVLSTLQRSPWIKIHWIDDLLREAKARISTLGTGEQPTVAIQAYEEEVSAEELSPIKDVALEWPMAKEPRLRITLDRQAIENEVSGTNLGELDFYVDGRKLCRWIRQREESWAGTEHIYAEPEKDRHQPNLRPLVLTVQCEAGETFEEWDFADSGLLEEVLVFDLDKERMVRAAEEWLEPNRHYAIVCDRKSEIQGCKPDEIFERSGLSRKVIRLPIPLDENICITYKDYILWQPVRAGTDQRPHFPLTLRTQAAETLSLNDRSRLHLEGLPENAEFVELLIHTNTYEVHLEEGKWHTSKEVTITPELAAGQRRVWARFSAGGRKYTQKPRLAFRLLGAVVHQNRKDETESFKILKQEDRLNRSEGTSYLRVWTPENDEGAALYEGNCLVGRLKHKKIKLKDIPGHGGNLGIMSKGERYDLGITCFDTGCVRNFIPPILKEDAQLTLLHDKDSSEVKNDGYALYFWFTDEKRKAKLSKLPENNIRPNSKHRLWKIGRSSIPCIPMAISLTWKGLWLGAWWDIKRIGDYINNQTDLPERDFAMMKWLRVPVLHSTLSPAFAKVALKNPCTFIETFQNDSGLPKELRQHYQILGLDSVIRHFLWNDFPPTHAGGVIDSVMKKKGTKGLQKVEGQIECLKKLLDLSPILLWEGLKEFLKNDTKAIIYLLRQFTCAQVGLPNNCEQSSFNYMLRKLQERASHASGISRERLEGIISERLCSMHNKRWSQVEQDRADFLIIGDTDSGRRYFSARMGQFWLKLCE